ncbi:S-protein homolog 1 [Linum perenne]
METKFYVSLLVMVATSMLLQAMVIFSSRADELRNPPITVHIKNELSSGQYHGHIVNELSPNKTLLVDCQCSDSDLGDHYINVGSEYQWSFKPHVFRSTTWHCYLAPDDNSHSYFAAFTDNIENVDAHHNFYWVAKDDGVYMRNNESHQDIYFDKWEVGHYL